MTLSARIIPCLDVDNGRVVKGVNFVNLVDAGDPVEMAKFYYNEGADELTFLDITASHQARSTTLKIVEQTAAEVFIPLTVGGGIRSINDVDRLLRAGADKISINTAALERPSLINEIADKFGSQVLVLSVDARMKSSNDRYEVTTHGGRNTAGIDALDWIKAAISRGVGEILLNSMDADGTKSGFDITMINKVREISSVPIIASGGAGRVSDFVNAFGAGANALLAASVFHFGEIRIRDVKLAMKNAGYSVRRLAQTL